MTIVRPSGMIMRWHRISPVSVFLLFRIACFHHSSSSQFSILRILLIFLHRIHIEFNKVPARSLVPELKVPSSHLALAQEFVPPPVSAF